jgi:hypothetical protein
VLDQYRTEHFTLQSGGTDGNDYRGALLRCYTHDDSIPTQTKVRISEKLVSAGDVLTLDLKMKDGAAFRIMPKDE